MKARSLLFVTPVLITATLLSSCMSFNMAMFNGKEMQDSVGSSRNDIVEKWGNPNRILTPEQAAKYREPGGTFMYSPDFGLSVGCPLPGKKGPSVDPKEVLVYERPGPGAMQLKFFYIDSQDTVYDWNIWMFQPNSSEITSVPEQQNAVLAPADVEERQAQASTNSSEIQHQQPFEFYSQDYLRQQRHAGEIWLDLQKRKLRDEDYGRTGKISERPNTALLPSLKYRLHSLP